jgi:hypothetical protein
MKDTIPNKNTHICPKCKGKLPEEPVRSTYALYKVYECENCGYYGELLLTRIDKLRYILLSVVSLVVYGVLWFGTTKLQGREWAQYTFLSVGLIGPTILLKDFFNRKRLQND